MRKQALRALALPSFPRALRRLRAAKPARAGDPAALLFRRTRLHLTFWYIGVLACALAVFGAVLYLVVQHALLQPIDRRLANSASLIGRVWQTEAHLQCPPPRLRKRFNVAAWACFTGPGTLIGTGGLTAITARFFDQPLIVEALRSGSAIDTVAGASDSGSMRLYARTIADPGGDGTLGVVLVGATVQGDLDALQVLLTRLIGLGAATVLGAALGGLLLANRALAPARLAFARQQTFIADASHELRTPLTLLRADADVLLRARDRLTPDDIALLEDMVAEASHMGTLASNLLTLARLDAGRLHLERDVIDLTNVVTALARRVQAYAATTGLTVHTEAPDPVLVIGDRSMLEQAILILLDNAIKYNRPGGEVAVRVSAAHPTSGHGQAGVEVIDTGIGIAAQHLPHLGERFYRVDKARSRETGGAGLGLSIARGIAHLHGGTLILASVQGEGTTAKLALPAARQTR